MYLWSLCNLYLLVCQVRVTVGDSGLFCCVRVTSFDRQLTPFVYTVLFFVSCFFFQMSSTLY